ncbi:hypothetical protein [Paraburkholderia fungorum]|jgi:hypothetical protein|nr:hypothetical protein [Paraburkholderia fungorum]
MVFHVFVGRTKEEMVKIKDVGVALSMNDAIDVGFAMAEDHIDEAAGT